MGQVGMRRNWSSAGVGAGVAVALLAATSAQGQFSDSYTFLKAVRDRDGDKVTAALNKPGNSMLSSYDASSGDTALHIVIKRRDATYLSFFLGRGADPNIRSRSGITPLLLAAQIGWLDGAAVLLQSGARVDLANSSGETPLIIAVHGRDAPMVHLLLTNNANPKLADRIAGKSALDYASEDPRGGAVLKILQEAPPSRTVSGPQIAGPHQ